MIFQILRESDIDITERVNQVMEDFDLKLEHTNECFNGVIDIDEQPWKIGLIVGGSGTGKSTIAKELFSDYIISDYEYLSKSVIDDMPKGIDINTIEHTFTSVGFSSPPCWLKPYSVLSTGEKMRVDLARALLSNQSTICFDEFTSTVDREVAKTCCIAIKKHMERSDKKFIAVSCHKDIIEYLQPDWIYDTDQNSFFGMRENMSLPNEKLTYIKLTDLISKKYGKYLGSITI